MTGGGSGLLASLLTVPGASASVLEAQVPYNEKALTQLIGEVDSAAQVEVAGALGMRAYSRAQALSGEQEAHRPTFGLGLTAALETTRPRRGANRAHISVQTRSATHRMTIELAKGRGRDVEEAIVSETALRFLLESLEIRTDLLQDPTAEDSIETESSRVSEELSALVWADARRLCVAGSGEAPNALLPGAFNPLHAAHKAMKAHAEQRLGCPVAYELCVTNVDKPPLDFVEIENRVRSLEDGVDLWLTSLPLFAQKAAAFPGVTFVVGLDTIKRIAEAKYYGSRAKRDASLSRLADLGSSFLVYGRDSGTGFEGMEQLDLPQTLAAMCRGVPESEFRVDVSSSVIRAATGEAADAGAVRC